MTKPIEGRLETITKWEPANRSVFSTVYGFITYGEWCEMEAARISKGGNRCVVIKKQDGNVAVAPEGMSK